MVWMRIDMDFKSLQNFDTLIIKTWLGSHWFHCLQLPLAYCANFDRGGLYYLHLERWTRRRWIQRENGIRAQQNIASH